MKRIFAVVFLCLIAGSGSAFCEDNVFLSLTKSPVQNNDLPSNASVINREDISDSHLVTAGDILEDQVGVNRSVNGTLGAESDVMIRGMDSDKTLVMIDGMNVNNLSLGYADLSTIPIDSVDRIEIVRGGSSALFGTSAFGGAINIITKTPVQEGHKLDLNASVGTFNELTTGLDFSVKKENVYAIVTGQRDSCDGFRQNSQFQSNDFFAKLGYNPNKDSNIELTASVYNNQMGIPGAALDNLGNYLPVSEYNGTIEKTASSPLGSQQYLRNYAKVDYTDNIGQNVLKVSSYGYKEKIDDQSTDWPYYANNDEAVSIVSGINAQLTDSRKLTFGGELREEAFSFEDLTSNTFITDKSRTNGALFINKEIDIFQFIIIPGIRADSNSTFGQEAAPKLSVVYKANDNVKISANTGKCWKVPTFNELYYNLSGSFGNPNLKPEEGISSDCGIEYNNKKVTTSLTLYQIASKNLIEWVPTPNTETSMAQNIGNSRQTGAEAVFEHRLSNLFTQKLNYTYLWAEDTDTHTELIYRPQNRANYSLIFSGPKELKLSANVEYLGSVTTGDSFTPLLSDYAIFGLKAQKKILNGEIWVRADNLGNLQYQTRLGYPLPGTTFSAGVSIKFV